MIKKNFIWNVIGSLVNASTSLFFMIIVSRINGTELAGVFSFAFTFSLLLQVIGSYSGRSYQVTETDNSVNDSDYIYSRIITCFLMIVFCLLFILFKNYSSYKNNIIFLLVLYKAVESFADVLYGIIQKNNKLYQVGFSLFLKGILMILIFLLINVFTNNLVFSIIMLSIVNIVLIVIYDLRNVLKCGFKLDKFNSDNLFKIIKGGFFVFVFYFLIQYVINAPKYSIDNFLSDEYQFIFGVLLMPSTLVVLFSQFFVQPFLNEITKYVKDSDYRGLNRLNLKISFILIISLVFIELFAYFLGIPMLNIIYGVKLESYKMCLLMIILGALFFGISYLISTSLIAMRKNFVQTLIYSITSVIAYFLSNYFVKSYKIFGASLVYLMIMFLLLVLYFFVYIYYVKKEGISDGKGFNNNSCL